MTTSREATPPGAPARGDAYTGGPGRTRGESAEVREPDGTLRSIELYTVVNAATDPALAALAASGDLHRLDAERELAVPFVYHDPRIELFVLVVPSALAHREFELRAALAAEIAHELEHLVPLYVRAGECVVGIPALRARLDEGAEPLDAELQEVPSAASVTAGAAARWIEPGAPVSSLAQAIEAVVIEAAAMQVQESEVESVPPGTLSPASARPAADDDRPGEMTWRIEDGEPWLHVQLGARHERAFAGDADLIPQYVEVDGRPIVLLTLVDASGEDDTSARLPLDPRARSDRDLLDRLAQCFRATLVRHAGEVTLGVRALFAPREEIVRAILARVGVGALRSASDSRDLFEQVLAAPPPIGNESMPFGASGPLTSPATVRAALARLDDWTRDERQQEALFLYGVPPRAIDGTIDEALRAAVAFGVALPDRLHARAVRAGTAPSAAALARLQLDAFRRVIDNGRNDLSTADTTANWARLIEREASAAGPGAGETQPERAAEKA